MDNLEIRECLAADRPSLDALYAAAFPGEDLLPLVQALLADRSATLSLVGMVGPSVAGHVMFTRCAVSACNDAVALLGPLAVAPLRQRRGVGSALVRAGLNRLADDGVARVCVLGDPAYYRRFGFVPEVNVHPPYALPAEWRDAWRSVSLRPLASPIRDTLCVPPPWRQPALWAP